MSVSFKEESRGKNNKLINDLNVLLASYNVAATNVHGFHWNIESHNFFPIHGILGDFYDGALEFADVIAERIRQFEEFPIHSMSKFVMSSKIKEVEDVTCCMEIMEHMIGDTEKLISMMKDIEKKAIDDGDPVTSDIMIEQMRAEEKNLWKLKSTLKGAKKMMKK